MILATGGLEFGATSTRSRSASCASLRATSMLTTPTCSPAGPTRRTSGTRIRSLVRGSLMRCSLCCGWWMFGRASERTETDETELHHAHKHNACKTHHTLSTCFYDEVRRSAINPITY